MSPLLDWCTTHLNLTVHALISEQCDVISDQKVELANFLQMSAGDFVKLSDVMGFSQAPCEVGK